jgi:hypothetical protein
MNITLSADKELIKKSREYARAHHTSLNQLIRDYLRRVTGANDAEKAADEFLSLANSMAGHSDSGFKFSRDAIYDRRSDG